MPKRASWIGESPLICSEDAEECETEDFAKGWCKDEFDRIVPKERQGVCDTLLDANLARSGIAWVLKGIRKGLMLRRSLEGSILFIVLSLLTRSGATLNS
jgi:hypothetical protein